MRAVRVEANDRLSSEQLTRYSLPEGFVYLVDDDMTLVGPVLDYLSHRFLTLRRSPRVGNTQRSHAEDLYEWWNFLDQNNLKWFEVTQTHIEQYRDGQIYGTSPHTGRSFAVRTVIRRLSTIFSFYRWASERFSGFHTLKRAFPKTGPTTQDVARFSNFSSTSGRRQVYPKAYHKADIRAIPDTDLRTLLNSLGVRPTSLAETSTQTCRDRLASEISVVTGARIDEVCHLTLNQINDLATQSKKASPVLWLHLTETKGNNERDIPVPRWLLNEMLAYIRVERAPIMARAKMLTKRSTHDHGYMLVNGPDCSLRDLGKPLRPRQLEAHFRKACIASGLVRPVKCEDKLSHVARIKSIPLYVFHGLRHTFALHIYRREVEAGNPDPWKIVQLLLGHRNHSTTIDIYGRSVSINEALLGDYMHDALLQLVK